MKTVRKNIDSTVKETLQKLGLAEQTKEEEKAYEPKEPVAQESSEYSSSMLPLVYDGTAIMRPNTLGEGCYYGDGESASDHAPVLYGKLGTWNIASPLSPLLKAGALM